MSNRNWKRLHELENRREVIELSVEERDELERLRQQYNRIVWNYLGQVERRERVAA